MEKVSGIYMIKNLVTGRVYIGSSVDIKTRHLAHKSLLKRTKHPNIYLQRSWNKYGEKYFKFSIIEKCLIKKLEEREQFWFSYHKENGKVYNIRPEFIGNNRGIRIPFTEEHKRKISESTKGKNFGRKVSEETKIKLREKRKGRIFSKETCKKISKALTGRKLSKEHIQNIKEGHKGYKHTEESKRKMSEIRKGYKHTEESKRKMSEAQRKVKRDSEILKFTIEKMNKAWKGKHHTEETKRKISIGLKEYINKVHNKNIKK